MLYNQTLGVIPLNAVPFNVYKKVCSSCIVYIILFAVFLVTCICIGSVFIYFYWYLNKDNIITNFIYTMIFKHINDNNQTNQYEKQNLLFL